MVSSADSLLNKIGYEKPSTANSFVASSNFSSTLESGSASKTVDLTFIKDAYAAKAQIPSDKEEIEILLKEITELEDKAEALKPEEAEELLEKHEKVANKKALSEKENSSFLLRTSKNKTLMLTAEAVVKELTEKIKEYEDNKEAIENLEDLIAQKKSTEKEMSEASKKMTKCEMESSRLNRAVGSLEQKVANAIAQRDE